MFEICILIYLNMNSSFFLFFLVNFMIFGKKEIDLIESIINNK